MYRPQRRDAARSPRRAGALPVFERQKPLRSHFIRRGGYALPDLHRPPALPQLFFGAHGDWRWPLLRGGRAPHFDQAGEDNARRDGRGGARRRGNGAAHAARPSFRHRTEPRGTDQSADGTNFIGLRCTRAGRPACAVGRILSLARAHGRGVDRHFGSAARARR